MLSSSSSTSISPRRCALLTAGGWSFVRAHLSVTTKWRIIVSWWSETRPISCPAQECRAVSDEAALDFIDELVPPSGSPSSSLVTPEDGGDLTPRTRHVRDLVPSGPDADVVVHDDDTPDPDASDPVDIILADETHPAVVHHTIPDWYNDVGVGGKDSMPTFTIRPRTPSIDLLALHHKRASKRRSRASQFSLAPNGTVSLAHLGFTSFHTPASSFSDGHELHHSALSSPLSRSCSPSSSSSPPFHNHRPYRLLSTSAMSTSTSIAPTITSERYTNGPAHVGTGKGRTSGAWAQVVFYLGQNGCRRVGGIRLRRSPGRHALGVGRGGGLRRCVPF